MRLFTVASWEDRFIAGLERSIEKHPIESVVVFFVDAFAARTAETRRKAKERCDRASIQFSEYQLYADDPAKSWHESLRISIGDKDQPAIVDISTMPRDVIWQVLWFLKRRSVEVSVVYHRPEGYGDWLSRDPRRPRLVFKMSGISAMGKRTALVITAGYDFDRVRHLIEFYEPAFVCLALQRDSVDPQNAQWMEKYRLEFGTQNGVEIVDLDAYGPGFGESVLRARIDALKDSYNVVCASLGPKLSAISLFNIHWDLEEVGLTYLPSGDFNVAYSHGIGDSIETTLESSEKT
ncbi:hypothetical protein Pla123a_47930 [Posidoniimonas polymericola]|uniref:Uncharacterized protein n=1 Tax=Posidoniimonas polymericola TaxID=2528002 RepID=A0A5C5XUU3_9BACT|nr:hypothetical protein [Posidoniimonas polymericola]TWT66269.1 hypothetical protein Pla123a_47930 [Posidoniimonas polymericola]